MAIGVDMLRIKQGEFSEKLKNIEPRTKFLYSYKKMYVVKSLFYIAVFTLGVHDENIIVIHKVK